MLSSTYKDFELIIINDASSDGTLKVLSELAMLDRRIKIFTNEVNLGIAESSNLGFQVAQGEFIAIMDADDIALPDRFLLQIAFLKRNSWIGVVGASMYVHSGVAQKRFGRRD